MPQKHWGLESGRSMQCHYLSQELRSSDVVVVVLIRVSWGIVVDCFLAGLINQIPALGVLRPAKRQVECSNGRSTYCYT